MMPDITRRETLFYTAILVAMGAGWGLSQPLTKVAVSTGYGHFGLVLWQLVIAVGLMGSICAIRRKGVPFTWRTLRLYFIIAMIGTIFPNTISYQAAVHLPAGVMSLLLSIIPMFSFAIALVLGNDHFAVRRLMGLGLGLIGVLIIIAPAVDLGQDIPIFWAAIYLVTALFYAFEGNYVAKWGTEGLDAFQVTLGAAVLGLLVALPLAWSNGQLIAPQWPLPVAQRALIGTSVVHVMVYATYVWLVTRAGAVFTAQVSYLVTGFGLVWARAILGEAYSAALVLALGAMFAGMYLVQPQTKEDALADARL